jgi:hypothetical protein
MTPAERRNREIERVRLRLERPPRPYREREPKPKARRPAPAFVAPVGDRPAPTLLAQWLAILGRRS